MPDDVSPKKLAPATNEVVAPTSLRLFAEARASLMIRRTTFELVVAAIMVCCSSAEARAQDVTGGAGFRAGGKKIRLAQVKSFSVEGYTPAGPEPQYLSETCSNTGGARVTVVAPVAGKIVARMDATYLVNHVEGTVDIVLGGIGTTAVNGCSVAQGGNGIRIEASWPTAATILLPMSNTRVLSVAAGSTTTLFLNSDINGGSGHQILPIGKLQATFIPD